MNPGNEIAFIPGASIDKNKWDDCISRAPNGLIYGYSWYLDHMADHWDGLVFGDYRAVMPLTWRKKAGIHYLYQPYLAAQLGVFGPDIGQDLLESFLHAVPARFRYWDIYLNHANIIPLKNFETYLRSNYVLNLDHPYTSLYENYRENIRRNRKKAFDLGCAKVINVNVEDLITLALAQMKGQSKDSRTNVNRFRNLYEYLHYNKQAVIYGINSKSGELLSSAAFFYSHDRAYYILVGNHPNGRTIGASHALIDAFIQDHAGKNLKLDFEGSDLRNLAFFYSSFGAVEEKYAGLRVNRLPWYLKWLKN